MSIWVAQDLHRAGPGGTGSAKFGGNYAASLLPQQVAHAKGFDQVCFLDAATNTALEELGGMNVFVVRADGSVATPELTGSILEGVTALVDPAPARRGGRTTSPSGGSRSSRSRPASRTAAVTEVFACGTAAVVTPIGRLAGEGFDLTVGDGGTGPVTARIRALLTDIQYGRAADPHGWMHRLL